MIFKRGAKCPYCKGEQRIVIEMEETNDIYGADVMVCSYCGKRFSFTYKIDVQILIEENTFTWNKDEI